jgi:uncharacterized membrane protein
LVKNTVGYLVLGNANLTRRRESATVQVHHWIMLVGVPIAVVAFFAATVEKRRRGDVALIIALLTAIVIGWYLLQNGS